MDKRGLSPIVATILLIAVTAAAATPIALWLANYYPPFRPRYVDLAVHAGLINENIVRFHIQHIGGETITFDTAKPTTEEIRGWAANILKDENELYCWTFENPEKFRQSDWVYAEVYIHDGHFAIDSTVSVRIISMRAGILYNEDILIQSMDQIPGG